MKRVLITGKNSYVGTNVEKWLMKEPNKYYVETISLRDPSWKDFDFSKFDIVFHVAGIAHVSKKKSMEDLYYKVNKDLTIQTAKIAKSSGVKQFIFMSSMIVYNSKESQISSSTKPNPDNYYGLSKLHAEEGLEILQSKEFRIAIIRPPMIYGPNSKGNFTKLISLAQKTPIFPRYDNKRSMLYIDNLSNSIKYLIDNFSNGLFFPQNKEYVNTKEVISMTKKIIHKKLWITRLFNPFIYLLKNRISLVNKMFSDSYYDFDMSTSIISSSIVNFRESLLMTVKNEKY
jgi:UDP-glucose 4-epimerase